MNEMYIIPPCPLNHTTHIPAYNPISLTLDFPICRSTFHIKHVSAASLLAFAVSFVVQRPRHWLLCTHLAPATFDVSNFTFLTALILHLLYSIWIVIDPLRRSRYVYVESPLSFVSFPSSCFTVIIRLGAAQSLLDVALRSSSFTFSFTLYLQSSLPDTSLVDVESPWPQALCLDFDVPPVLACRCHPSSNGVAIRPSRRSSTTTCRVARSRVGSDLRYHVWWVLAS